MADSPAAGEAQGPKKITFRFCRECANLLYPEENKEMQKLQYICRTCNYKEDADTTCIFRHELGTTVGDTAGITQDIGEDPTVGDYSGDPNADFYTSDQHGDFSDFASFMNDSNLSLPARQEVPDMCTMCGQEIYCEQCGQPSDRGLFLEVDEEQLPTFMGQTVSQGSKLDVNSASQAFEQLRLQHAEAESRKNSAS